MTTEYLDDSHPDYYYYRWYLVDNQETSYLSILRIVEGWYRAKEDVYISEGITPGSEATLYTLVCPIVESATPYWIIERTQ